MTRVSIVIPFRDAARWLPACLDSLAVQEERNWELLAVDDGSRDHSAALVDNWAASHRQSVRLIRLPGLGVASARNSGWAAARSPLVAFLDADDIALPGRLDRQAARFDADSGLQHLLCGWRRLNAAGTPLHDVCPWQEGANFDLEAAFEHKAVLPSAWMLRRPLLERHGGFDPSLRHAEDVDLLLRLAAAGERGGWLAAPDRFSGIQIGAPDLGDYLMRAPDVTRLPGHQRLDRFGPVAEDAVRHLQQADMSQRIEQPR